MFIISLFYIKTIIISQFASIPILHSYLQHIKIIKKLKGLYYRNTKL